MSKWRKALKNKRRFDARYFLNERVEGQEVVENSVQQEEVKRNFNDFSFDPWLTEAKGAIDPVILDLIKQRIKEVGFGDEDEEDFESVKIELVDDGMVSKLEIENITFDQFVSQSEGDLNEMHCTSKRDNKGLKKEQKKDCKPDSPDLDNDGNKRECISDAAEDKVEEIVGPQGASPDSFATRPGDKEITGIKPYVVKILKDREKAAHLGPVPDNLKPETETEKNEG